MTLMAWAQLFSATARLAALLMIGYGEYRLWTGTTSPTARGLSLLFAAVAVWGVTRTFAW